MRRLAYFLNIWLTGMPTRAAWHQAGDETEADKPRLIDYSMGWDEFDDWPYTKRPAYDTSHRKSIWQILTRE